MRYPAATLVLIMVLIAGLFSGATLATELPQEVWVCIGGDDDDPGTQALPFATIQKGIDSVAPGGTVYVNPSGESTYAAFVVNKDGLTIIATGTAGETIVDSATTHCITVTVNNVHIEELQLVSDGYAAGICFPNTVNSGTITIKDSIIDVVNHAICFCGGITNSTITISDNKIDTCPDDGYEAVMVDGTISNTTLTITNNEIKSYDETISLDGSLITNSTITISGNDLETTSGLGMRIWAEVVGSTISISNNPSIKASSDFEFSDAIQFSSEVSNSTITIANNASIVSSGAHGISFVNSLTNTILTIINNDIDAGLSAIRIANLTTQEISGCAITISYNDIEAGQPGVHVVADIKNDSTLAAVGNTVTGGGNGFEFRYFYDSTIELTDNTVTVDRTAMRLRRSYDSTVTLTNNFLVAGESYEGIRVDDQRDTTLTFLGNTVSGGSNGIRMNDHYRTQVYVVNNTVTGTSNYGINFYDFHDNSTLWAVGNTVTGSNSAMYVCCIDGQADITIKDNVLSAGNYGMYFSNRIREQSTVLLSGNTINNAETGIYFSPSIREDSTLTIADNTFNVQYTGIHFSSSIYSGANVLITGNMLQAIDIPNPRLAGGILFSAIYDASVTVHDNLFSGFQNGVHIWELYADQASTQLTMAGNMFTGCGIGIAVEFMDMTDPDSDCDIQFNAFIGNETGITYEPFMVRGLGEPPSFPALVATLNWWGSTAGPQLEQTFGTVNTNPWLMRLSDSPATQTHTVDTTASMSFILLDSNSDRSRGSDLWLSVTVSGAHDITKLVKLVGGRATFSYTGTTAGTDTVTATVLFAGQDAGLEVQTEVIWNEAAAPPPAQPTPGFPSLGPIVPKAPADIVLTIDSSTAYVGNTPVTLDAPPYIQPGTDRTMVPIRFVVEQLGATVFWLEETKQVRIIFNNIDILLTIGSTTAVVNGEPVELDCAPEIINGRTFVPLRFVSETLGATVVWDQKTGQITITR